MLDQALEEQAAIYVSGALPSDERERFALVLEFHAELRGLVEQLQEVALATMQESVRNVAATACPSLKERILRQLDDRAQDSGIEGIVVSRPNGLVEWVNPAFSDLCGYSLEEVRGKRLGPLLQGELTDAAAADRMRRAVRDMTGCRETIVNYHKSGTPYWVSIDLGPVYDSVGNVRWMVACEREAREAAIAA